MPLEELGEAYPSVRVSDWAYERLRNAIHTGELRPGERLAVPALAQELKVSRSPVREAVQRLVRDGLARDEPRRGAVVADISHLDLRIMYDLREVLEGLAARLAAQQMTDEDIEDLQAQLREHAQIVETGDLDAHMAADQEFHSRIRAASENPWLVEYLDQLQSLIRLAILTTSVSAGMKEAHRDHTRIFDAIAGRDPQAAERLAREHIERLRNSLDTSAD